MAQTILNDEASEALHHLNADVDAALRYLPGGDIPREHAERWAADLKTILGGRVTHPRTRGPGKRQAAAA
jgi:hypothetical protein